MIFFRADGNSEIGAGHIMRCLSIADAAVRLGNEVSFYTAGSEFSKTIIDRGITNIVLGTDFMKMESEIVLLKEEIKTCRPEIVFVDSYYVTFDYLKELLECCYLHGTKLVYIDDIHAFAYPCDYLVNYNIYGPDLRQEYLKLYADAGVQEGDFGYPAIMLGVEYLPLRKEFSNLESRKIRKQPRDILVSTGGADSEHVALGVVAYILSMTNDVLRNTRFHILIGAMNEDKEQIEELAKDCDNIELHFNVRDMLGLMQNCDVAISAAGSTLYELCATQTPTITYVLADNQIIGAEGFYRRGIMEYAGDARELGVKALAGKMVNEAITLMNDKDKMTQLISKQKGFAGNGADRLLEAVRRK